MRALVIGLGVGEQHVKAYREEGLDVVVCDTDPAKLMLLGKGTTDYRTEIRDADIVSVCTPDETHFEIVSEALRHGCYVVVEKPPCLSEDEMEYLMQFGGKIYCNLPLSYHFAELIADVGNPYLIELEYNWGRHHKFGESWRKDGYSILLGAGLHMFDLLLCLKNDMPIDGAALGSNKSGVNADYDCFQSLMRYEDGTMARVGLNCGYNGAHIHRVALYERDNQRILENRESVDKTAGIRDFVNKISRGEEINNTRLWDAMKLAFHLGKIA
jgi:predicted dehydrogenase